ncbi:hypothetical protein DV736_g811, partial [Chaetothyriales sp. CBS 134916]
MVKKVQYVNITSIPSHIPRQLAIDMLHSHGEIIELNPLVLEHHLVKAPRDAPADEFFSVWHEITERIQYIPGMGRMGSGKITFKGVFHDIPLGLQTHIYAPAGVDMRNRYEIRGNQPGEPPEPRELGSGAPSEGLYLREEVEFKCNFSLAPFVKSQNKAAAKTMLDRLVKKAELIDQEILRQMMEAHRNSGLASTPSPQPQSPGFSPALQYSPNMPAQPDYRRSAMLSNSEVLRQREEVLRSSIRHSGSVRSTGSPLPSPGFQPPNSMMEMMGSIPHQQQLPNSNQGLAIEMMGDTHYNHYSPAPLNNRGNASLVPPGRQTSYSELDGGSQFGSQFGGSQASRHSSNGQENMTSLSSGWGGSQGPPSDGPGRPGPGGYRYQPRDFEQDVPPGGR